MSNDIAESKPLSGIVMSTYQFSPESQERLQAAAGTEVICIKSAEDFIARLPEAEVVCSYWMPREWRSHAASLRWLQGSGAGIDGLAPTGVLDAESGVIVTTANGIHGTTISEYVLCSMLMFNRNWPEMVRLQDQHIWPRSAGWYNISGRELDGQTISIIGLGSIGRNIARLARAFGMHVLATRRSTRTGENDPDVDELYPMDQLHDVLRRSDYIVLAVPLTKQTEHLIGEAELRVMKPSAYLVNIARGRVIDEAALIQALREHWIAGAGLDVASQEPLPEDSPLYTLPNVILTPHISGVSVHYGERLAALFADNLQRYRTGQPLRNRYDPARGY
jgi:phosphoglycerate dehydrogenase-like enzyme